MKNLKNALIIFIILVISSCEVTEMNLFDNPNFADPELAQPDELFNKIQLDFNDFVLSTFEMTAGLSRMKTWIGGFTYNDAFRPSAMNEIWDLAYAQILPDVALIETLEDKASLGIHIGASKVMKAYVMVTLVDLFGDVPYSEAGQGTDIISPRSDDGASVYEAAREILKEGKAHLEKPNQASPRADLYYGGDAEKWLTLANTLELKMLIQTRLVNPNAKDEINKLLSEDNLIDEEYEDFEFTFNRSIAPDSRHPLYVNMYDNEDRDFEFLSNYYMWLLKGEKGKHMGSFIEDPRIRFYFYRQISDVFVQDPSALSCMDVLDHSQMPNFVPAHYLAVDPDMPFCMLNWGFVGRDHLNGMSIPSNFHIRTIYGLYPVGGKFDDSSFNRIDNNWPPSAGGSGINPILLSSFIDFMRAEAALTLETNDDAKALLESGIQKSIAKVFDFEKLASEHLNHQYPPGTGGAMTTVGDAFLPNQTDIDLYVDLVMASYDEAPTDDLKLDIIMKEYFIALWGNGIEAYNNYRRTCMPLNMQPAMEPTAGEFPRTLLLPSVHVNLNENVDQSMANRKTFWDINASDCTR